MIKSIQILRAIAALEVSIVHYGFVNKKYTAVGVDVFFIISGFIISFIIDRDAKSFLYRRVIRVFPPYLIMTILISLVALVQPSLLKSVSLNTIAFFKSIFFIPYEKGPILLLGWTLNYEMFFYFITYVCLTLASKPYSLFTRNIFIVAWIITFNVLTPPNFPTAFYSSNIVIEFVLGSLLYKYWQGNQSVLNTNRSLNILPIILGIIAFPIAQYSNSIANLPRFVVFGVPAMLFVNMFLQLEKYLNIEHKITRFWVELGNASYIMYLIHPFIIYFLIRIIYPKFANISFFAKAGEFTFTIVSTIIASLILHKYMEKPILHWLRANLDQYFDKKKIISQTVF